jgi:hypothetical protein
MVTAQLSLFDTSPVVGTLYKAGDWVKVRKKPSGAAAWVKRGEVFRIDTVHPIDGSLRFWNPHINQWGFLYPDEVSLIPAPIDSVTTVSTVSVTESITEPGVTESIAEPDDSVTKAISTYRPKGTARSGEYFRFSYRDGSKVRHIHIRGGNTDSPIAQAKVEEVRSALAAGVPAVEIVKMLRQ